MAQRMAGPGLLLPLTTLYPSSIYQTAYTGTGNTIELPPGYTYVLPAGDWWLDLGAYSVLQWYDPVTTTWRMINSARRGPQRVWSDGSNFRVANLLGCPIAAIVTAGGSNYAQATTTAAPSIGNSTWQPVIGGTLSLTIGTAGTNYTIPPLIDIDPPAAPGVQATARGALSGGTLSTVTLDNLGAGYTSAPAVRVIASPSDPNIGIITAATVTASINTANAGKLIALLCTNPGQGSSTAAVPTFTFAGAGAGAAATALVLSTVTGWSITNAGVGVNATNKVVSQGGQPTATEAFANPAVDLANFIPRPAEMIATIAAGAVTGAPTIYDGGLFLASPGLVVLSQAVMTTGPILAPTIGTVNDVSIMQPA